MAQERDLATRIVSLVELQDIVAAIRAIAASQMQQALRSLEAIRRYSDTIGAALSDAAKMLPSDGAPPSPSEPSTLGLILFCAEHGLCGGFNERPLRVAEQLFAEKKNQLVLIVVGSRGGQICHERGLKPELVLPMATHCAGVTGAARRLATEVYRILGERRVSRLEVIHAQHVAGETWRIERRRLLPLEMPQVERPMLIPPLINLSARRLFNEVAAEYFFAALENAAMQSFFSESLTRFRAMEAAHQNIQNKSAELSKQARRLRQEAVTTELLDLISAAQALSPFGNSDDGGMLESQPRSGLYCF